MKELSSGLKAQLQTTLGLSHSAQDYGKPETTLGLRIIFAADPTTIDRNDLGLRTICPDASCSLPIDRTTLRFGVILMLLQTLGLRLL